MLRTLAAPYTARNLQIHEVETGHQDQEKCTGCKKHQVRCLARRLDDISHPVNGVSLGESMAERCLMPNQ
jgi:hypothetical protein